MAAGDLQMAGAPDAERDSPPPTKAGATFGFTPAQQMMFQSSNMNGQRVVMVTPEVARSLGLVSGAGTGSGGDGSDKEAAAAIKIEEESGDVSVSVMETEDDDGMIDPDQFLEVELASGKAEAVVDEDLTSLSWLHSKNLLKASDVKFRQRSSVSSESAAAEGRLGPMSAAPLLVEEGVAEHSEESPTSDYLEDVPDTPAGRGRAARTAAVATVGRNGDLPRPPQILGTFNFGKTKRHPPHLPYDPKVHVHFKPPFSFSCLIFMSIEDSPQKAMPVKEIYNWIQEYFPFYQTAPIGWKNSVRHNLSLNKCFRKIEKSPGPGKGSLWTVDPLYRPHLIQALKRSPCVQETPSAFGSRASVYRPWTAAATALSGPPQPLLESPRRGPARRPPPPPSPAPVETPGPGGDPRSTESLEAAAVAAVPVQHPPPPATPAQRGTPRRRGRGVGRPPGSKNRPKSDDGGPNPDLFPLLSRRLLSSGGDGDGAAPAGSQAAPAAAPAAAAAAAAEGEDEPADGEPPLMIVQEPPAPETTPARCRVKVVKRPRDSAGHDYGPVLVSPAHRLASGEPAAVAIAKPAAGCVGAPQNQARGRGQGDELCRPGGRKPQTILIRGDGARVVTEPVQSSGATRTPAVGSGSARAAPSWGGADGDGRAAGHSELEPGDAGRTIDSLNRNGSSTKRRRAPRESDDSAESDDDYTDGDAQLMAFQLILQQEVKKQTTLLTEKSKRTTDWLKENLLAMQRRLGDLEQLVNEQGETIQELHAAVDCRDSRILALEGRLEDMRRDLKCESSPIIPDLQEFAVQPKEEPW